MEAQSPTHMAKRLASYMRDPSTIRVRVLEHFGRAPSVDIIRLFRAKHEAKTAPRKLCSDRYTNFDCGHAYDDVNVIVGLNGIDSCAICHRARIERKAEKAREDAQRWKLAQEARKARRERANALQLKRPDTLFPGEVVADVARMFGVTVDDLKGPSRLPLYVDARAVITVLLRDKGNSYPQIARRIGRKDHSTTIHLYKTFPKRAARNPKIVEALAMLR